MHEAERGCSDLQLLFSFFLQKKKFYRYFYFYFLKKMVTVSLVDIYVGLIECSAYRKQNSLLCFALCFSLSPPPFSLQIPSSSSSCLCLLVFSLLCHGCRRRAAPKTAAEWIVYSSHRYFKLD